MTGHAEAPSHGSASSSSEMDGSVALLFLSIRDVKNPDIWEGWVRDAPQGSYDVYVHAKRQEEVRHRFFRDRHVETVRTKWGTVSLVQAHINLLRAAVKNKRNKWFVLLSDSCMPMVSFESLRKRLHEEFVKDSQPISAFDTHAGAQQKDQRKNLEQLAAAAEESAAEEGEGEGRERGCGAKEALGLVQELVAEEGVVSHSQWCLLGRRDARALARAEDLHVWYEAYRRMVPLAEVKEGKTLAPDELLVLSYLKRHYRRRREPYKEGTHYAKAKVTFSHCCLDPASCRCSIARAAHPLHYQTLHPDILSQCLLNRSLFARKFDPGMKLQHWDAMWAAEDPEIMLRIATLSTQLAHPEKLTLRQQTQLAMQLSQLHHDAPAADHAPATEPFSALKGKAERDWEEGVGRFSRKDAGRVVEIVCREELEEGSGDGLCGAVLHRHVRGEEFVVRFKDGEEVQVDLGRVKVRPARAHVAADMQSVVRACKQDERRRLRDAERSKPPAPKPSAAAGRKRGAAEVESDGGGGERKKEGGRKRRHGVDELEPCGSRQQRSREDLKLEADLRRIAALEKKEQRRQKRLRLHHSLSHPHAPAETVPALEPDCKSDDESTPEPELQAAHPQPLGEGAAVADGKLQLPQGADEQRGAETGAAEPRAQVNAGGGESGALTLGAGVALAAAVAMSEEAESDPKSSTGSSPVTVKAEEEAEEAKAELEWQGRQQRVAVAAVAVPVMEQSDAACHVLAVPSPMSSPPPVTLHASPACAHVRHCALY